MLSVDSIVQSDRPIPPEVAAELARIRRALGPNLSSRLGTNDLIRAHVLTNPELAERIVQLANREKRNE